MLKLTQHEAAVSTAHTQLGGAFLGHTASLCISAACFSDCVHDGVISTHLCICLNLLADIH
jgi:hypothetical protein